MPAGKTIWRRAALVGEDRSKLMRMPVMHVRIVRVHVYDWLMEMLVRVGFGAVPRETVGMLVMGVVPVPMPMP